MHQKQKSTASSVNVRFDERANSGIVSIEGALTEQRANEASKALDESFEKVNYFKLNLEKVTAVDMSSVQLLYSASMRLIKSQKHLRLEGICPLVFASAVEDMGLSNQKWLCFGQ